MELGAAELALALEQPGAPRGVPHRDSRHYVELAAHWAHAYIHGPNDAADTLNLYDVSALGHAELIRAMRGASDHGLAVTRAGLLADLRRQLARGIDQGRTDPFGFGYGWAQYDTTTHGTGLAVTASLYDQLTHSHRYAAVGMRWLGNVLGANAWGSSFILGDGQVFPHCTQHQVANIVGSLDGTAPVLAGAAVEGPNSEATTRPAPAHAGMPRGRRRRVRALQLERGLPRQRGVLLDRRAGDRPDGDEPARLRQGRGGDLLEPRLPLRRPRRGQSGGGRSAARRGRRWSRPLPSASVANDTRRTPVAAPDRRSRACTRHARRSHTARPETAMSETSRVPANRIESGEWLR